ncbi:hypothetical protein DUNSADRAFT_10214, partial [Dunaliella salina]
MIFLRQLRHVGTASAGQQSLMKNPLFVPSSDVAAELQGHQRDGLVSAHTEQDCAQFKAATVTGTRREHYKCLGVGAGCCKHGKILIAASLLSEESTGYYVTVLERFFKAYNETNGRSASLVFMDIACQFGGARSRLEQRLGVEDAAAAAAARAADFVIGPWHLLPHKARWDVQCV